MVANRREDTRQGDGLLTLRGLEYGVSHRAVRPVGVETENRYHYLPNSDDVAAYRDWLALAEKTQTDKGKRQEALKRFSKWLHHEHYSPSFHLF